MASLKRGRAKKLVLDIGASAVRLCELTQTKAGYQLTKYYHREFGIDPSMDEEAQRNVRSEVLKNLLKESKVRHRKVVFGVPGQSVFTRSRTLPPVPEYKVTQIVRYEIQQQIPFSLDQIAFDYQVLQRTEAGGYDVLMAAIKVDVVEKRLEIFRDLKRQIDQVDVCPIAAYNWLKYCGEFGDQGECVALVDLGAVTTDIVIEREGHFRFTRSLNLGGNDITAAVAAEFGMAFADAEKLKRERGFAPTGDPQRDGKGGEVIGRVLNRLVSEVNRSFSYFRSQPGGGPVSRVVVTGGGACLRNMIPFLQRQLGVEVRIAQPLAGLAIAPGAQDVNEHPEQAAVALGLALRCCEGVAIGINLIPPRIRETARRKEQIVYWSLSLVTFLLIVASVIPSMAQRNRAILEQIELTKNQVKRFDPRMIDPNNSPSKWKTSFEGELKMISAQVNSLKGQIDFMDTAYSIRHDWVDDIVFINDARPRGKYVLLWSVESTLLSPGLAESDSASSGQNIGLTGTAVRLAPLKWQSSGFQGIHPPATSQAMGSGQGGRRGGGATPPPAVVKPPNYNGITIMGYAENVEALFAFRDALLKGDQFVEGGVYFDDRFVDPVPLTVLDDATTGAPSAPVATLRTNTGSSSDSRSDRGGLAGLQALRSGGASGFSGRTGPQSASAFLWGQPNSLVSFRMDLQISGPRVDTMAPEQKERPSGPRGGRGRTRYDE